jgi:hypothetical protein
MLIYTNSTSKLTRKQKQKKKDRWIKSQQAIGGDTERKKSAFIPLKVNAVTPIRVDATVYKNLPSISSAKGDTFKKPIPIYTGDAMIGIGTLHKSNAVPIFSTDEAKEISRMRRG